MIRVLQYGPTAAIVECPDIDAVRFAQALQRTERFLEVVPAEQSVLVTFGQVMQLSEVRGIIDTLPRDLPPIEGRDIEIPVDYDGADLARVAELAGISVAEVVALHSAPIYCAAFSGFAPGYVYCTGLDPRLQLPRRSSPRTSVPAGSVAIADVYTAVYPSSSPGGWHLLGRTDLALFDLHRPEPALIRPGDRVRFIVRTA